MMSTHLVVDDERTLPINADEVIHARSSKEAIQVLIEEDGLDSIWLDHDLGGDDTGMVVVDYLCMLAHAERPYRVTQINIISMNPGAAKDMQRSLGRYGYRTRLCPYSSIRT